MTEQQFERQILDHGYLKVVEVWGSDEMIVESARMSTGKGFLGWGPSHTPECSAHDREGMACFCGGIPGDEKLLRFLYENKHSTPFEFAGMTIEVQAPLMVFREWHRHRTQSYSERSARYAPLPDSNYLPTPARMMIAGGGNKQAGSVKGSEELTYESSLEWLAELADVYEHAERVYQSGLRRGVPKELARLPVPVGRYSTMRATTDLRNWLAFTTLRSAPGAQFEIRQYSFNIESALSLFFPRTMELFRDLRRGP